MTLENEPGTITVYTKYALWYVLNHWLFSLYSKEDISEKKNMFY